MTTFDELAGHSSLPIVDLRNIESPRDGFFLKASETCKKNFGRSAVCRDHYRRLHESQDSLDRLIQCPYGFSTMAVATASQRIALTGVIPFPRLGGESEREMAKRHPECKQTQEMTMHVGKLLRAFDERISLLERDAIKRNSVALHEIRKLNRSVKQTAERMCLEQNRDTPENADSNLVRIWKSAELMSAQFEIIELLANESLTQLPLNSPIEIYRIVDKCVRIYKGNSDEGNLVLRTAPGFRGRIMACDKTFPIIPTVLIENAIKYSLKGETISVNVYSENRNCVLAVTNAVDANNTLNDTVFEKGQRGTTKGEGSGNGLYLAQLVARQHRSRIRLNVQDALGPNRIVTFSVRFAEV